MPPPTIQKFIPYYLLILAVIVIYGDVYDNGLLYDDTYLIGENLYLRSWHALPDIFTNYVNGSSFRNSQFYRPLQNLLYLIVYQLDGLSLFGFHFLNITLHATNACLVYALGLRLKFNPWGAFLAALIWAVHPLATEAVTYLSSTADSLHVLFCLAGLIVMLPDFQARRIFIGAAFYLLALISKEAAIIFPILVMTCLFLQSPERLKMKTYFCVWPLWSITVAYLAMRWLFMPINGRALLNVDPMSQEYATHISYRLFTFLATLPSYAKLFLWPVGLHMDRDFPVYQSPFFLSVVVGALCILALIALTLWGRGKRALPLTWAGLWFFGADIPQTGVLTPVNSLFLEHWMYLPSIGLFLGMTEAASTALTGKDLRRAVACVGLVVAVLLGVLTYQQNKVWYDPITFYTNILNHGETSVRAHNNLGIAYSEKGDYAKAMEQFQLSLKDHDLSPETHQNMAMLLSKNIDGRTHIQEEITELNRALIIKPDFLPALDGLGDIYNYLGDSVQTNVYRTRAASIRGNFKR